MTACCLFFRQKLGHVSWKVPGSEKKKFSIQSRLKLGNCHRKMMKVYIGHKCCTQTYKKTFRANYYKPGAGRKTPCAANAWSLGDLFDLEKFHCVFTLSSATASNNCTYPQFATIEDRTEELVWLRTCVLILQSWVCFNAINKWARKSVRNLSWSAELFVAFVSYSVVDYLFCLAFQFFDWYTFLGLKVFCVAIRDAVFCLVFVFHSKQPCFLKKIFQKLLAVLSNPKMETERVTQDLLLNDSCWYLAWLLPHVWEWMRFLSQGNSQRNAMLICFWHPKHLGKKKVKLHNCFDFNSFCLGSIKAKFTVLWCCHHLKKVT